MKDLQRLIARTEQDSALAEKLSNLEPERIVQWAATEGYQLTLEEASSLSANYEELSDDDLEMVAGGWTGNEPPPGP